MLGPVLLVLRWHKAKWFRDLALLSHTSRVPASAPTRIRVPQPTRSVRYGRRHLRSAVVRIWIVELFQSLPCEVCERDASACEPATGPLNGHGAAIPVCKVPHVRDEA